MTDTSRVLAELAREVARQPASEPLRVRLCHACARILQADGAAITLSPGGVERVLVCATDDVAERLEDLHEVLADGPGHEAIRTGRPVEVRVTPAGADRQEETRSPFVESAFEVLGPLTVYAVPLHAGRAHAEVLGVLVLYRTGDRPMQHVGDIGQVLADAVGAALLREPDAGVGAVDADEPEMFGPWTRRATVHQATGMVAAQLGLAPQDALVLLRAHAYAQDQSLDQIAQDVVQRRLDFTTTDTDDGSTRP